MRPSLLLLFFLFLSILPTLPAAPDQRLLVIAAPSLNHDAYRTQAALLLPALAGLNERDFVVQIQFGTKSFSVVLIGKDGGEKLRRAIPLSPEELFAVVDAMPMRRAEMRGQK
jgi:hypothetical protein